MTVLTLQPDETTAVDCYIGNGAAASTAFDSGQLLIGSFFFSGNTTYYRALVRFDLSTLPDGALPSACDLTITWDGGSPVNPSTYTAYRLTRTDWTEAATWNNYDGSTAWATVGGDYTSDDSDAYVYGGSGTTLTFDLLGMLTAALLEGATTLDIILIGPEASGSSNYVVGLSSAESTASERPKLEITYELSIHQQCAVAAGDEIAGLELPGLPSASILVRKFPYHNKDRDPLPAIIVSTHLPTRHEVVTNLSDDVMYPVTISFVSASNANKTLNQGRMLSWRETVRRAFHQKRLSGVDSVWNCTIPPSAPFDPAWFVAGMRDVSPLTLQFISREQRN